MIKHLKFDKIQAVERRGALMLVWFLDDEGNMYDWAPKWADVEKLYLKQINVERFNKPDSDWLNKFAKTAQTVVENAQRTESARKIYGVLSEYRDGKLVISARRGGLVGYIVPGFEVSLDFLDSWLGKSNVEVFVINNIGIRIKDLNNLNEYPPLEEESEDIPS
jgi:hypothetical protein